METTKFETWNYLVRRKERVTDRFIHWEYVTVTWEQVVTGDCQCWGILINTATINPEITNSALLSCCLLFKVSSADTCVVIHGGDFSYSFHYIHLLWMNFIQLWTINSIELIKRCSTMPLYIGRYLKTQMVNKTTAVFPPTKNFPLHTAVHIFIVTNRISFRKIKIDEWASYYKLIRNVHPWQETVTVQTIYIFFDIYKHIYI